LSLTKTFDYDLPICFGSVDFDDLDCLVLP